MSEVQESTKVSMFVGMKKREFNTLKSPILGVTGVRVPEIDSLGNQVFTASGKVSMVEMKPNDESGFLSRDYPIMLFIQNPEFKDRQLKVKFRIDLHTWAASGAPAAAAPYAHFCEWLQTRVVTLRNVKLIGIGDELPYTLVRDNQEVTEAIGDFVHYDLATFTKE